MIFIIFKDEDLYKDKIGIYVITNLINNKVYVGQTRVSFKKRYLLHKWKLENNQHDNRHLQQSYNKYSSNCFEFSILKCIDIRDYDNDNNILDNLEIKYIKKYRADNLCYNIVDGGRTHKHFYPMSEHTKKLIGDKNRIHMLGKKHSEETKKKMSESRKGKHYKKSSDILTYDEVVEIKTLLVNGLKPKNISEVLNIKYELINGILSNNTFSYINVDGWDEFQKNRTKSYRLTSQQSDLIYKLYNNGTYSKKELAEMYNKNIKTIEKLIRKYKNK